MGSDNLAIANKVNKNKINKNISLEDVKIDLYEDVNPPDDGIQRNWESLKKWLVDLRATREQANRIILFSNYGEIGTPIWKLFNEIRNAGGQIKQPVLFVLSRLV
ncbi:hypothetical protein [Dysgonomonas massiliensis]|uniref:hypothetical protein n=1 Tax=Dysgonomonas massiliensis TaxID=2040292 RepID=UPI000C780674|nr:hypothetical protein [Dysgonomonas massiliensis]